ncbi:phosphoribosyl-ATP diphosphatase [Yunchengibacter salinarum]|uniref:phosphoribosyl-ATP diphosphatase n=1 Tax=Yunchengibacter salinarum TaxID=3133399 RepID=UPI0035B65E49
MTHTPDPGAVLARLEETLKNRKGADPDTSYVARLLDRGVPVAARKMGEEAVETVVAALGEDDSALLGEAADLMFHLMVLLTARGLSLSDVTAELARREGLSGLTEKARRGQDQQKMP